MRRPLTWRAVAGAALLYALAAVVLTWPLGRHPAATVLDTKSLYGDAGALIQRDINLTTWVLAWDAHALATHPLGLFDANAFYPARYSLAFSEHMLGNLPWFAPVWWATRNGVLAHQATLLATFVLAGLAMAAWARYWIDDGPVVLAAGFLFAFAPFRFWQFGNLHVVSLHGLPLVLLAIDAMLDRRGGRLAPVLLAAALALSALCSYYTGYAAFALAGVYLLVSVAGRGGSAWRTLSPGGLAIAAAGAVVAAVTVPYVLLQRSGVLADYTQQGYDGLAFLGMLKLGVTGLLSFYVRPIHAGIAQFLTFTAMALALVGVVVRRGHPRGALLAVAGTGALLSLGPYLLVPGVSFPIPLPYQLLAAVVPGFSAMRVPQRFGALTTLAVVALATFGLAELTRRLRARGRTRAAVALPGLVVALFLFEATPRGVRPYWLPTGDEVPPAYHWLAAHGDGGPLLELPAFPLNLYRESLFMYYSTVHWLPLVNGYTGYPPRSYVSIMETARTIPAPGAVDRVLAQVPLRWVLLHRHDLPEEKRPAYQQALVAAGLRPVSEFGDDVLYELPPA